MARKVLWPLSLIVVAIGAVALTRLLSRPAERSAESGELGALRERLDQLEGRMPRLERSVTGAGARLAASALNVAAHARATGEEGGRQGEEDEARDLAARAEVERRHYDRLDGLARTGAGGPADAQLRKNLRALQAQATDPASAPGVGDARCGETVCRVELTLPDPAAIRLVVRTLGSGLGGLSMRPLEGNRTVFYVAPPGQSLPPIRP